jgi:hypothetical protein
VTTAAFDFFIFPSMIHIFFAEIIIVSLWKAGGLCEWLGEN